MNFILATNNKNKMKEMKDILTPLKINVFSAEECGFDLDLVEENGETLEENARIKAISAFNITGMASIADDTGLMVDALGGKPGIYSARYAGENANYIENLQKLLLELKSVPMKKRTAKFICSICCIFKDMSKIEVKGECEGYISEKPIGSGGFGYDPIFVTENGKTFGELSFFEKNSISHRGKAIKKLVDELKNKFNG